VNRYLVGALLGIALLAGLVVIEVTVEPGKVDVPSLVGLDLREALDELQSAGLRSGVNYNVLAGEDPSARALPARVLRSPIVVQSPAAGTEVDRGTQVEVTIRMR
jgi:beta-lactam-binding protein with PASTA domain